MHGPYPLRVLGGEPGDQVVDARGIAAVVHDDAFPIRHGLRGDAAECPAEEVGAGIGNWLDEHASKVAAGAEFHEVRRLADGRIYAINTRPLAHGGWVDVHEDITETQRSSERIADLARKDTLTGLANQTIDLVWMAVAVVVAAIAAR